MAQAAQFTDFEDFPVSTGMSRISTGKRARAAFDDLLLDDGFDQIGDLDFDAPGGDFYRRADAFPQE